MIANSLGVYMTFQSTLPARGATIRARDSGAKQHISIHAPREGSDLFQSTIRLTCSLFQSTLPARGATDR